MDIYEDIMANVELIDFVDEIQGIQSPRRIKNYRERSDPFLSLDDVDFKKKYRFSKTVTRQIVEMVADDLGPSETRGGKITPELQVLACLCYWGRGEIQDDASDIHGFSQPTLSVIAKRVATALARRSREYIKMPTSITEQNEVMEGFMTNLNMRQIIGAIDGTHIKIKKIGGDSGQYYVNRKGFYSLNVQAVCDSKLVIRDIVARWRGSTHDSRIFRESYLKERFDNGEFRGYLLGDSGYACMPYLLTPLLNPSTPAEERYNRAHISTRNCVERCFGVWKQRFRCLLRGMYGSLETTKVTIIALAVLHNIAMNANDLPDEADEIQNEDMPIDNSPATTTGSVARRLYINLNY